MKRPGFGVVLSAGFLILSVTAAWAVDGPEGKGLRPPKENAACKEEVKRLCPGIKPGEGRVLKCLREHKKELSEPCRNALDHKRPRGGDGRNEGR